MPGGGFTPGLVTTNDPLEPSVEFLASQHYQTKRGGITLDASTVAADGKGNKIVKGGTALYKIAATGKYTPTATGNGDATGLLFAGDINVKDGDTTAGLLIHGSVLEARCTGITADVKTALAGRITFQ